jgi:phage gp36-like protein
VVLSVTYATLTDLTERFGDTEVVAVAERALADAGAEIDGYLVGRYRLPLPVVPRTLVGFACDIARYRLYDDRATEQVTKRYDDAAKFLRLVADGRISLGPASDASTAPSAGGAQISASPRVFDDDSLADYAL